MKAYTVLQAGNGREVQQIILKEPVDLVLSDIRMPEMDGMTLLAYLHKAVPETPVIMLTAYGTVPSAVAAMHAGPPDHRVSVTVWESTEEPPPWSIRTRQILARRTEEGLYIKELMVVDATGDKTWIGRKDADGKRATLELPLSGNTGRADFYGGFVGSTTDLVNGRLVSRAPVFSGATQFVFGYVVPVTDGKASVEITCPADTAELAFAVLDDGSKVSVKGLEAGDPIPKGKQKLRVYVAKKVKAGEKVTATLSGIPEPPPPPPAPKEK